MSLKILVADSEPKSLPLLSAVATPLGHSVLPFKDYQEAAQRGETQQFDVAFLGMRLPELTGIGVAGRLRNSAPNHDAAIVMFTSVDDIPTQRKAFGEGADFILTEPVQAGRLHRLLSALDSPGWKQAKPAARLSLLTDVICSWLHRKQVLDILNISETGLLLRPLVTAPEGEEVILEFKINEGDAAMKVRGRIVRKDESAKLTGVEFVKLPRQVRQAIHAYVMGRAKDESPRGEPSSSGSRPL